MLEGNARFNCKHIYSDFSNPNKPIEVENLKDVSGDTHMGGVRRMKESFLF